jgi:DNA polymerase III subunit chi
MTRINFYFNVTNKPQLISDLVASALSKHRQVTIFEDDEIKAKQVSDDLWHNKPESFLPNSLVNHALAENTPVVVYWHENQLIQDDMLINLTANEPQFFSRFTQLVEIVGLEEQDKVRARARYKFYRDRGYDIKNIDFAVLKDQTKIL